MKAWKKIDKFKKTHSHAVWQAFLPKWTNGASNDQPHDKVHGVLNA